MNKLFDRIYCCNRGRFAFELNSEDENVVTDLSLEDHVYDMATVYDHHEPSLGKVKRGVCDLNRCGTRIFYEEYVPKEMHSEQLDKFVSLIDSYDRWQESNTDFTEGLDFTRMLGEVVPSRTDMLIYDGQLLDTPYRQFIDLVIGNGYRLTGTCLPIVHRVVEKETYEYISAKRLMKTRVDRRGYRFGITYIDGYVSQIANRMLKETGLAYMLVLSHRSVNRMSARSLGAINLNSLKGLQGHCNAAGGTFDSRFLSALYRGIVKSIEYEYASNE